MKFFLQIMPGYCVLGLISLLLLSGCAKELSTETGGNPPVDSTACVMNKVIFYDNGLPDDSVAVVYENDKIVRYESLTQPGVVTRYTYTGDRLEKAEYLSGSLVLAQTSFVYNAGGEPVNIVTMADLAGTGTPDTIQYYSLTHAGGKLSTHKVYGDASSTDLSLKAEFSYTWTGDNITSFVETLYTPSGPLTDTIAVQMNGEANLITAANPQAFYNDFIVSNTLYGEFWALGINKNTVIRFVVPSGQDVDFAYEKTSTGKLRAIDIFGERAALYRYSCD